MSTRELVVDKLIGERERNFMLPDSESDITKAPNDWIVTIMSYLIDAIQRGSLLAEDFDDGLTKAGGVLIAAMEHIETMKKRGHLA